MEPGTRGEFESRQLSNWWFDLSKLAIGSVAIPVFFLQMSLLLKTAVGVLGFGVFCLCAYYGLEFARLVKE